MWRAGIVWSRSWEPEPCSAKRGRRTVTPAPHPAGSASGSEVEAVIPAVEQLELNVDLATGFGVVLPAGTAASGSPPAGGSRSSLGFLICLADQVERCGGKVELGLLTRNQNALVHEFGDLPQDRLLVALSSPTRPSRLSATSATSVCSWERVVALVALVRGGRNRSQASRSPRACTPSSTVRPHVLRAIPERPKQLRQSSRSASHRLSVPVDPRFPPR